MCACERACSVAVRALTWNRVARLGGRKIKAGGAGKNPGGE